MGCLACDAASRDALDLLDAVVADSISSDRVRSLVNGMDPERTWRVLLFMAGFTAALAGAYSGLSGVPQAELTRIFREETEEAQTHGC